MAEPLAPRSWLESQLGPLELRVLDAMWARSGAVTVRDLTADFPGIAYTTLMTTADRLYRKGLLARDRKGRAFAYVPRWTREALEVQVAGSALATLLPGGADGLRPLMSLFVDEVSRRDVSMLDELERLVRLKRQEGDR